MRTRLLSVSLVVILILIVSGCNGNEENVSTVMPQANTAISTPTNIPSSTITPSEEITQVIRIPTSTPKETPTLNPTEKILALNEMIKTNGGCKLPCWWGFTPGITFWKNAHPILKLLTTKIDEFKTEKFTLYGAIFGTRTEEGSIRLVQDYLVDQQGIIQMIKVSSAEVYDVFPIQEMVNTSGKPDEIWISTYSTQLPEKPIPFSAYLFYSQQGFIAIYHFQHVIIDNQNVTACGKGTPVTNLWAWKPGEFTSLSIVNEFFSANFDLSNMKQIQEVSALDPQTFSDLFKNAEADVCISTPKKYWHPYDGY